MEEGALPSPVPLQWDESESFFPNKNDNKIHL